jgi:restriction system protein
LGADTSIERIGVLVNALMELLRENPDGLAAKNAIAALSHRVELTDYELGTYNDGSRRYDKVVRFATIDLKKAGWMIKNRGVWFITPEGVSALTEYPDATERYRKARALYAEWRRQSGRSADESTSDLDAVEEADRGLVLEEAESEAWDQVRTHLSKVDPYELQDIVAALLEGMGYHVSWSAPPGKDGGVDVIAFHDPLGTSGPRIKVQVKRWANRVPLDDVRSFISLLGTSDIGVFVSTGGFTKDAEDHARNQESRRITLLDADRLFQLWVEHYDKISEQSRSLLPVRAVHFLDKSALG